MSAASAERETRSYLSSLPARRPAVDPLETIDALAALARAGIQSMANGRAATAATALAKIEILALDGARHVREDRAAIADDPRSIPELLNVLQSRAPAAA